ncbi:MAG: hypothetical protein LUH05_02880 [Candidatus Gastranaerophilales bacterium]|nr:hypothetical protein [Candidatus Gastranaerophilales bacterium]
MKKSLSFLILLCSLFFFAVKTYGGETDETENILKIREGAFVKVMVRDEFSTLTADIGDEVTFINTSDMYVYETNAIPENTIFYGEIEDVREPVEGKDGALKISIYKMITPDKKVYKLTGHIYSENGNYLGGNETAPAYYHKVPHYSSRMKPFLQAAPLNIYQMGKHTVVKPGAELFLIFEKDVILK